MSHLKSFLSATLMLLVFGISAVAAQAEETKLPSILLLPGVVNVTLTAESTTQTTSFAGIEPLNGTGYKFVLEGQNMSELGVAKLDFLLSLIGTSGKKCKTSGDTTGIVLIPNAEWHLALGLSSTDVKLFLIVILVPAVLIECEGGLNVLVKAGAQIINALPFGVEVKTTETFKGRSKCEGASKKTPEFSEYDNMSGGMTLVKLESEIEKVGLASASCLLVSTGVGEQIEVEPSQAVEIMEP